MNIANKISAFNRKRKWGKFLEIMRPTPDINILDVGFSEEEYSATDNFMEKNYPYPHNITALGIDTPKKFIERYPHVKAVKYDGKKFPFENKKMDICWSNAVLEHVGNETKQILFLKEIKRTCKKAFITTPNKKFPFEVHTHIPLLHFLPKKFFDRYLSFTGKEWATGDYMNLLTLKGIKSLLKEAGIYHYKIIRNKFLFFTLDFIIIFNSEHET